MKNRAFDFSQVFSCEIKRPSSTKKRNETEMFRVKFLALFSKM